MELAKGIIKKKAKQLDQQKADSLEPKKYHREYSEPLAEKLRGELKGKKRPYGHPVTQQMLFELWRPLTPAEVKVYLALCIRGGTKRCCWPTEQGIAKDVNLSLGYVKKIIKRLESIEFIRIVKTPGKGWKHNEYILLG